MTKFYRYLLYLVFGASALSLMMGCKKSAGVKITQTPGGKKPGKIKEGTKDSITFRYNSSYTAANIPETFSRDLILNSNKQVEK